MKRRFLRTSALRHRRRLRDCAQKGGARGRRAERALAILDRALIVLLDGDPVHAARVAIDLISPMVRRFDPATLREFAELAIEVAQLNREIRESLSSGPQLIPGYTIEQQRSFVEDLPRLPVPEKIVGSPPGRLAHMAREMLDLLLDIHEGRSNGPEGAEFLVLFMQEEEFPSLTKESFSRPRTDAFNTWYDCSWELLEVLASHATTSTDLEYRRRLRALGSRHNEALTRTRSEDINIRIRGESDIQGVRREIFGAAGPVKNEYAVFLSNEAVYGKCLAKKRKANETKVAEREYLLRTNGRPEYEIRRDLKELRKRLDDSLEKIGIPKAKAAAKADLKKNFKKTCEREWPMVLHHRLQEK